MAELRVFEPEPHDHGAGAIDHVLADVVNELQEQADQLATPLRKTFTGHPLPSRKEVVKMIELLQAVIFPGYVGNRDVTEESLGYHMGSNLHQASLIMVDEIHRGLCFACQRDKVDRTPEAAGSTPARAGRPGASSATAALTFSIASSGLKPKRTTATPPTASAPSLSSAPRRSAGPRVTWATSRT